MEEQKEEGVAGERSLDERLADYPELRERLDALVRIVENAEGDALKADDAEEQVFQEIRQLGRSALQGWAERKQRKVESESERRNGVTRKEKKRLLVHAAGTDRGKGTDL